MTAGPVVVTPEVLAGHPLPDPDGDTTKHARGGVLVVGGTGETPGAVLLAGVAALRAGAGRLQVATVASAATGLALAVPEAMVVGLDGDGDPAFDAAATERLGSKVEAADAVLVGPGTFAAEATRGLLAAVVDVLAGTDGVLVVDAGALAAVAERPELVAPLGARAVLMPNPSEAARLLDVETDDVDDEPRRHLAAAVERFGATVSLRGAETWTAGPGTGAFVDRSGSVGLATCGSGDVLAGLIAGCAARGAAPLDAVLWATRAHAAAGQRCAARCGPVGFLARDLLDEVGPALAALGR